MTDFHEVLFPLKIRQNATLSRAWSTKIVTAGGGDEQRLQMWENSKHKFDLAHALTSSTLIATAIDFFHARAGRAYGFRVKDFLDYSATTSNGFLGLTGVDTGAGVYQLYKRYGDSARYWYRPITKPVSGTIAVYRNGIALSQGAGADQWTIDTTTGKVTVGHDTGHLGQSLTWSGQFNVPVRFDSDELDGKMDAVGTVTFIESMPMTEVPIKLS